MIKALGDYEDPIHVELDMGREGCTLSVELEGGCREWDPDEPCSLFPSYEEEGLEGHVLRGRRGDGLRTLASVASRLEVVGGGSRVLCVDGEVVETEASDEPGLLIEAELPWPPSKAAGVMERLRLVDYGPGLTLNAGEVEVREPDLVLEADLETVIHDHEDELRVDREAQVSVTEVEEGGGLIAEMGFPLATIKQPLRIDVSQRVPLDKKGRAEDLWLRNVLLLTLDGLSEEMEGP